MFLALTKFVASVYHNDDAMLNQTMEGCHEALRERGHVTNDAESLLLTLLQLPLDVCATSASLLLAPGVHRSSCRAFVCCHTNSPEQGSGCHLQKVDLDRIVRLDKFPQLLSVLRPSKQRQVALTLVRNVAGGGTTVASAEHMRTLGAYLRPLVAAGEADADVVRLFSPRLA